MLSNSLDERIYSFIAVCVLEGIGFESAPQIRFGADAMATTCLIVVIPVCPTQSMIIIPHPLGTPQLRHKFVVEHLNIYQKRFTTTIATPPERSPGLPTVRVGSGGFEDVWNKI